MGSTHAGSGLPSSGIQTNGSVVPRLAVPTTLKNAVKRTSWTTALDRFQIGLTPCFASKLIVADEREAGSFAKRAFNASISGDSATSARRSRSARTVTGKMTSRTSTTSIRIARASEPA